MEYQVRWTGTSLGKISKLDKMLAGRIIEKIESIKADPLLYVKRLTGINLYSLRIGDYRVIIALEKNNMFILDVGHRRKSTKNIESNNGMR
jgi:mRNA interferase RelE/StbE